MPARIATLRKGILAGVLGGGTSIALIYGGHARCDPETRVVNVSKPSASSYSYVIAGGGSAAVSAVRELVKGGKKDETVLVVSPTFQESSLLKTSTVTPGKPLLHSTGSLWDRIGFGIPFNSPGAPSVEVATGHCVQRIDPVSKEVTLENNAKIEYDKVLIATGGDASSAEAAVLQQVVAKGAESFTCFLQTSTAKLKSLFESCSTTDPESPHVTVVGGSWAAVTMAVSLLSRGASITLSYSEPHLLARHLPKFASTDLVRRLKFLAKNMDLGVDTLSYSVVKYIGSSEVPPEFRRSSACPGEVEQEANVFMSLVFDAFDLIQFRSDLVLFAPTSLGFSQGILPTARVDESGKLVSTAELSICTDVFAAGSCLADHEGSPATWSSLRAEATGAHAARNMLGNRLPFPHSVPRFEVDLSALRLRLFCSGSLDGNCETRGFFAVARDSDQTVAGGNFLDGVVFYLGPVRQDRCDVVGICVWTSDDAIDAKFAFSKAEEFLGQVEFAQGTGMDRRELALAMDSFAQDLLARRSLTDPKIEEQMLGGSDDRSGSNGDADCDLHLSSNGDTGSDLHLSSNGDTGSDLHVVGDGDSATGNTRLKNDKTKLVLPQGQKYTRFHRAARMSTAAVPSREIMSVADLGYVVSSSSRRDRRTRAYDKLIRDSIRQD